MLTKGKLVVGLASIGMAVGALFPVVAGADDTNPVDASVVCGDNCGGYVRPGEAGLTNALVALETNPSASDSGGVAALDQVISFRPGRQKQGRTK